jgi:hypothetical protein
VDNTIVEIVRSKPRSGQGVDLGDHLLNTGASHRDQVEGLLTECRFTT